MGIAHHIVRLLCGKTGDGEEVEGSLRPSNHHPYQLVHDQPRAGHSPRPHTTMSYLRDLFYRWYESLTRKLRGFFMPGRRTSHPTLPVQNLSATPTPTIIDDYAAKNAPLLQGLIFSSPHDDDQPLMRSDDQVIISIPEDFIYLSASEEISSVSTEDIKRVPCLEVSKAIPVIVKRRVVLENEEISSSSVEDINRVPCLSKAMPVIVKSTVVVNEGRWIKHYSSRHRILLVGEGDFSFSTCLALAFRCASNMVATSLDSEAFLKLNYKSATSNIEELRRRGCKVLHGIDATKMANHELLGHLMFDRIIFNFPFAGFFKDLPRNAQLRRHQRLVSLFLKNAKEMISEDCEIHVTHKTNAFHVEWKLEEVAASHKLRLIEAVRFNHRDYAGYHTKYGFGGDKYFNCNPSKTYKFTLVMC